jgi:hypothetical protein
LHRSSATPRHRPLRVDRRDPTFQAYAILSVGFTIAPILMGIDKFTNWVGSEPSRDRISVMVGFVDSSEH